MIAPLSSGACMHVRMPLGEGCDKEQLVAPYPPHTASPLFQRGLRFGPAFRGRGDVAHDSSLWERQVMHGRDCFPHQLNAIMSRTTRASGDVRQRRNWQRRTCPDRYRSPLIASDGSRWLIDGSGDAASGEGARRGGPSCAQRRATCTPSAAAGERRVVSARPNALARLHRGRLGSCLPRRGAHPQLMASDGL